MRINKIKKMMTEGKPVVNGWLQIPSTVSAEVMAHQGWDSLTIDMQHGLVDYTNALPMLQTISSTDVTPLARVNWNEPGQIMKILDAGCYGVICPMVSNKEEAEKFVQACMYPPDGPENSKAYSEILRILEHAKKNKIFAGIHNGTPEYALKMIDLGFNFVTIGSDQRAMSAGSKNVVEKMKGSTKAEESKAY